MVETLFFVDIVRSMKKVLVIVFGLAALLSLVLCVLWIGNDIKNSIPISDSSVEISSQKYNFEGIAIQREVLPWSNEFEAEHGYTILYKADFGKHGSFGLLTVVRTDRLGKLIGVSSQDTFVTYVHNEVSTRWSEVDPVAAGQPVLIKIKEYLFKHRFE